jgi:acyl dehydratase
VTAAAAEDFPEIGLYPLHVDPDAVYAFARATNDDNERYVRGEAVPPLFTAQFILGGRYFALADATPEPVVDGASVSLHGEHDIVFHGPVLPGMDLAIDVDFVGARQKDTGVVTVSRFLFSTEDGTPLVEHFWTNFYLGGSIAKDVGDMPPGHAFPAEARQRPVGSATVTVDRDQTYRYAGVSHDHAPHAVNEASAAAEGYPGKILQGLCTFSLCAAALVDLVADGDPDRLRRLAGRFSAPVLAGRDFTVDVYDSGATASDDRSLAFEAIQDGVVVIRHGQVDVSP